MANVDLFDPAQATGEHKEIFDDIEGAMGGVLNIFKAIGNSHAALESLWTSFGALGKGNLDSALTEKIAVHIANFHRCAYCLAAHTKLGLEAGATEQEMADAQLGKAEDEKTQTVLDFVGKVVEDRGQVSREDVQAVRNAGYTDEDVAEIIAHVALNTFTNYTNIALDVPLDFPKVEFEQAA